MRPNTLGLRKLVAVTSKQEAVKKLKNGQVSAYIADSPHAVAITTVHCDIHTVGRQVSV